MRDRSAPLRLVLFALLVSESFALLFFEQRKPLISLPAAPIQPPFGLAHLSDSQVFFIKITSSPLELLLLIVATIAVLAANQYAFRQAREAADTDGASPVATPALHATGNDTDAADARSDTANESPEIRGSYEELEEELRNKDDFIGIASHELKTPLTTLKIYIQSLEELARMRGQTEYVPYFKKIDTQIDKVTHLVSTLLDVARIEGGKITYAMKPFDLCELVRTMADDARAISGYDISMTGDTSCIVHGDKDRIAQVLNNLITNAIKYSPDSKRIEIEIGRDAAMAIVGVRDHGIGIDAEHHARIFERFFRVNTDVQSGFPGMGVGLYISSQIIAHHGGAIWVESVKGSGSAFHFSLPLA